MNKFKIGVVFELEKEHAFECGTILKKKLRAKYGLSNEECSELNRLITNYQVKKYGSNLTGCYCRDKVIKRTDNNYKSKIHRK